MGGCTGPLAEDQNPPLPWQVAAGDDATRRRDRDPAAPGFSFADNYVSALFQPRAINGTPNAARAFAVPAMLLFCVSNAVMFRTISKRTEARMTRKVIEIFGIGSMVYTFIGVCTVMHDILVIIAAAFFAVSAMGMLSMLSTQRRPLIMSPGLLCLALLLALAAMRHGNIRVDLAPLTEWLLFALGTAWLVIVHLSADPSARHPA